MEIGVIKWQEDQKRNQNIIRNFNLIIVLPVFEMDLDLIDDERIKVFSFGIAL